MSVLYCVIILIESNKTLLRSISWAGKGFLTAPILVARMEVISSTYQTITISRTLYISLNSVLEYRHSRSFFIHLLITNMTESAVVDQIIGAGNSRRQKHWTADILELINAELVLPTRSKEFGIERVIWSQRKALLYGRRKNCEEENHVGDEKKISRKRLESRVRTSCECNVKRRRNRSSTSALKGGNE